MAKYSEKEEQWFQEVAQESQKTDTPVTVEEIKKSLEKDKE